MSSEFGRKPSEITPQQLRKLAVRIAGEGQLRITVAGNSMHPSLQAGDALLVDAHLRSEPGLGQIVTFLNGDTLVTHRIVGVRGEEILLKGDNAPAFDPPARAGQMVGRVIAVEHAGRLHPIRTNTGSRIIARVSRLEGRLHEQTSGLLNRVLHRVLRVLVRAGVLAFFRRTG